LLITRVPFTFAAELPPGSCTVHRVRPGRHHNASPLGRRRRSGRRTSLLAQGLGLFRLGRRRQAQALFALCLMGATLGFLRYNLPARVFWDAAASSRFGVGVLAVITSRRPSAMSPWWCPLLDFHSRHLLRDDPASAGGRSPFSPDRRHIHHGCRSGLNHTSGGRVYAPKSSLSSWLVAGVRAGRGLLGSTDVGGGVLFACACGAPRAPPSRRARRESGITCGDLPAPKRAHDARAASVCSCSPSWLFMSASAESHSLATSAACLDFWRGCRPAARPVSAVFRVRALTIYSVARLGLPG